MIRGFPIFFLFALFSYIHTSPGLPLSFYTDIKTDRELKKNLSVKRGQTNLLSKHDAARAHTCDHLDTLLESSKNK